MYESEELPLTFVGSGCCGRVGGTPGGGGGGGGVSRGLFHDGGGITFACDCVVCDDISEKLFECYIASVLRSRQTLEVNIKKKR